MLRAAALALLAATAAFGAQAAAGVREPTGFRLDDYRAPVPASGRRRPGGSYQGFARPAGSRQRPADRCAAGTAATGGMRPDQPWLPVQHRDIPGSLWLPDVGRGALSASVENWFRNRLAQSTAQDKRRRIVFYCLSRCWMGWNAAKRAAQYGYRRVYWYPDGSDGWEKAGLDLADAKPEPMSAGP